MALSDASCKRVVEAVVVDGRSRNAAAKLFKVSIASAVRWVKQFQMTGDVVEPCGGDRRSGRVEADQDDLMGLIRRTRDITLPRSTAPVKIAASSFRFRAAAFFDRHRVTLRSAHAAEQ